MTEGPHTPDGGGEDAPAGQEAAELSRRARTTARRIVASLPARNGEIATAESLTAGLVSATLADVPGVSQWLRGGIVAYNYGVKSDLLGVDPHLLAAEGAINEPVATAMARGVVARLHSRWGVATTGAAGPGPVEGRPAGTAWIAVADGETGRVVTRELHAPGDRAVVRWYVCHAALELLAEQVEQNASVVR